MEAKGLLSITGLVANPVAITSSAGALPTDVKHANHFSCTVSEAFTLSNPLQGGAALNSTYDMMIILWRFKQDPATPRTISFDTKFRFGSDILSSINLTQTINKIDYLAVRYHSTDDKFDVIAFIKGF